MGNANIVPRQPRNYLYHAYLTYMEANGYKNVLSLKMFGLGVPMMLKEYGLNYAKRHTRQETQTNIILNEESNSDWLPKCDDTIAIYATKPAQAGFFINSVWNERLDEHSTLHLSLFIHHLSD
ncbi:Poxvirus D5 protein-like [Citrobacter koseri]|uniref:Poxvirus D5 protein-like n=1 Tax=Citrobacter koseri TaxID=545 RepID=A0A3S4I6M4_CITKO|nr:Poxvirus D5 protein-like [Citrobacter koseri]